MEQSRRGKGGFQACFPVRNAPPVGGVGEQHLYGALGSGRTWGEVCV